MQRALRDEEGIAQSLAGLGSVAQRQEEYAVARSLYEESLAISRELRDTFGLAASLGNLGMAALREGNHEQAASFLEESLNLFRELGAKDRIALTLDGLGRVALAQGDYGRALPLFQESLELLTRVNYKWACANCLVELALLAVAQGQPERATRLLGAADSLFVLVGVRLDSAQQEAYDRCIAEARAKMGSPDFEAAWSDGQSTDLQEATRFALSEPTQGKQTAQVSQRAVPDLRMTTSVEKAPQPAGSESAYIEDLTDRERQVLGLVATGKSNPQIANELYLSINTVQAHLRSIFSKLGVASRIEAVRYAYQHAP